ncbi:jg2603 [Pararge aegeria aegeria]|uniref:Jg2603 protein n=1 Tax=Pararge aegeria aegeria TaxID=348720 RepID=A0A8S4S3D3_9NEOP|nr:jg2603 [Pararge aegeria aegeria]
MWDSLAGETSARIPTKTQRSRLRPSWGVKGSRSHATLTPRRARRRYTMVEVYGGGIRCAYLRLLPPVLLLRRGRASAACSLSYYT